MSQANFDDQRQQQLSEAGATAHRGFPNPATDQSLQGLDLNKLLVKHSAATFFMRAEGQANSEYGIQDQDILIVDKALPPGGNDLVVWWQADTFKIAYANQLPPEAEAWGVISASIRQFKWKTSNEK